MKLNEIITAKNEQYSIILDREAKLKSTDYIAAKIAEGAAKKSDYAEKIAMRQQWRNDINAAQEEIAQLDAVEPDDDGTEEEAG